MPIFSRLQLNSDLSAFSILAGAMAIVFFKQHGDVEVLLLCGCDEQKQRAQFLRLHRIEPMQIILTDAREQSLHHRKVAFTDGAPRAGWYFWHGVISGFERWFHIT